VIERLRRLAKRLAERKSSRGENKKTIYVTYYHTGSQLLIWTLKGSDLNMVSVARSEKGLRGDIEIFRRQMLGFHPIKASARRLYRLVLKPVAHRLDSNDVVIIPYGALHTVPFAALHDGKDYLSKRYAFRYGSSFSAFAKEPASLTAEPNYLSVGWAGKTNDIPMAEKEAENFKTVYADATLLLGEDAKRNDFLAAVTKASLVHIATHAHYLENAPLSSSLELADGPLELTDILQLKLNGPLVVISACETGKGLLDGAHGTVSFQRAFLAAGASALLSSLWRVNDLGSALLMKYFFRELKEGQHAAVALQNAQNELRKRYAHPAFWAAFRLDDLR
jgi:CHAT domain-containing protein